MDFVVLNNNSDFRRVYARGKYVVSKPLITYCLKNNKNCIRVGITTSKKIGNAVVRNRCRRVIRESYRQLFPDVTNGYDFVFVARAATFSKRTPEVCQEMRRQLEKLGVL